MSTFTNDEFAILNTRGFKPASGYSPIRMVKSHNISYTGYGNYSAQTADDIPPCILDLGLYGNFVNGSKNGTYDAWFSDIAADADSYPIGAKGIRITVTNPVINGVQEGRCAVVFIDKDGNVLSGGESTITTDNSVMGEILMRAVSPCYVTVSYRQDITPPRMMFGLKFSLWGKDSMSGDYHLYTDRAIHQGVEGTYVDNEPWYNWYKQLENDSWFDPESQTPDMEEGGGGGGFTRDSDTVGFPALPAFDICGADFIRLYSLTNAQLSDFGDYLWDNNFFNSIIKNQASPFENIIGLFITPLLGELTTAPDTIQIGNVDTGVSASRLSVSIIEKDFGQVDFAELYKNFADYSPYTKLQIYLPFIGKREINPDNYMDGKMWLKYQMDVFSGSCVAHLMAIRHGKTFIVDSYNGNLNSQIPICGANYASMYQAQINGVMTMMSGAVSQNAGAVVGGAANAIFAKPTYEKAGTLTGSFGRFAVKTPYIFFDTPQVREGKNYRNLHGYMSNIYVQLNTCKGFTKVKYIDMDGITAPDSVKERIRQKLSDGIYIHEIPSP